jgi:hypothetical protein
MRTAFPLLLIVAAAASRLLPHPPNVTPVAALALFGAVHLDRRVALVVPLAALLLSDLVLGFYQGMIWVYGSFVLIGLVGFWLKRHPGIVPAAGATLVSSVLFFIVTNFGFWTTGLLYPMDGAGLLECYAAAIPFFRNTLIGDAAYVTLLFGASALVRPYFQDRTSRDAV